MCDRSRPSIVTPCLASRVPARGWAGGWIGWNVDVGGLVAVADGPCRARAVALGQTGESGAASAPSEPDMKPILILQNLDGDDPAYFGRWLHARGVPFEVRQGETGAGFPASMAGHSALAILGGEMSANDPLPSLRRAEDLVREAFALGRPVIGHCLGGQLMARALGQRVQASPAPEVGWQPIAIRGGAPSRRWFGDLAQATVFQWHYESFEIPPQADWLALSEACPHQAFSIGPHLAMQFHIEVDADKVLRWSGEEGARWAQARHDHPATVQDAQTMELGVADSLAAHQALADRLYAAWLDGVAGGAGSAAAAASR